MSSTRKSKSVNKRFPKVSEESPDKHGNKSRQRKRKLSDMVGSQWSKEELECFYEAFRKYGKDWKKVAGVVRNRSIEMVEALYNMNRAYLSLPEGTASVVGLIAMMTDHYNILEGSESERESNDGPVPSQKPQKRARGKFQSIISKGLDGHVPDLLQSQSFASNYGCLSLLKKKRSGGSRPRVVGKRTPRFPVSHLSDKCDMEKIISSNKQGPESEVDANDEGAHGAVLVLAEALHRGGSPQVSHTSNRRTELMRPSPVQKGERMHAESEKAIAKLVGVAMDEDCFEGSLGSREAENGDFARDTNYMMDAEGDDTVEVQQKRKKDRGKKPKFQDIEHAHFDDVREACSGTEEGPSFSVKEKVFTEVTNTNFERSSPQGPRKRSRQLLFEDESSALEALCTLADVSMKLVPTSMIESESSVQSKEGNVTTDIVQKSCLPEAMSANHQRDKSKISGAKEKGVRSMAGVGVTVVKNSKLGRDSAFDLSPLPEAKQQPCQSTIKIHKNKRKPLASKLRNPKTDTHNDSRLSESQKTEVPANEGKKSPSTPKHIGQIAPHSKRGKSVRPSKRSSNTSPVSVGTDSAVSSIGVCTVKQFNLPTKLRSRRKMNVAKPLALKVLNAPENIGKERPNLTLDLKEKLSLCLSSQMLRRWCAFEWFYSAIDYPWFAEREFVDYLNHVNLGHVPRLTRVEWGVIRSSIGKPRRLSQKFLQGEREKLEQYREFARTHYTELRAGIREEPPTDLAWPLSVGQRVIACHPKTRELNDGSVLTVDQSRCRVQFDRPELGVEFVMDIDCMPSNPLENIPEALRKQNVALNGLHENFNELKMNGHSNGWMLGGFTRVAPHENLENSDSTHYISSPAYPMNVLLKQAKGDTINAISQAKAAASEIVNAQKAAYSQPCNLAQIQAREADIQALSGLTRALAKKEVLVLELRHMNDEVLENEKNRDNSLKDSEPFKKQYATVLVQLKEANDQVSSALMYLQERNTYLGNSPSSWLKSMAGSGDPIRIPSSFDQSAFLPQGPGPRVVEILNNSTLKARTMVDAAVQAVFSLKEGEDAFARVREALDSVNNPQHGASSGISAAPSFTTTVPSIGNLPQQEPTNSCTSEPTMTVNATSPMLNIGFERSQVRIPSELICTCIATMVMIQTCTERQYPPAEVAQILDSVVTSLIPCCSENLPIYRDIQMCLGVIKNQILALIPTPTHPRASPEV